MALVKLPSSLHQFSDLPWADDIYVLAFPLAGHGPSNFVI